jgi:ABC-type antimicrobial peptide transport system permease subunit
MGLKASFMIAWRSLSRRKSKNISAILAVALGVTLLVGIQITTATLENSFLSSLSQSQGEVDLQIANNTLGGYLKAADQASLASLVPEAKGIMPELTTQIPALVKSQFDPKMSAAGISLDYPQVFGDFYDWKTGSKLDLNSLLSINTSILISSNQAEKLGLNKDTLLPVTLTTEFNNLTTTFIPPVVPLSEWVVNTNLTSGKYVLSNNVSSLFFEIQPVDYTSVATIYTVNCPQLNLTNYSSVNVTATGTSNAGVILGFLLDDGSAITVANMTDPATLDSLVFDLTPYAGRTLRGEGFMTIMSLNGTQANVNITEIAFESPNLNSTSRLPIVKYSSEISRVDLQVVGIFDSNHPGVSSQYSGAVFKLEHLQEWISLQDPNHVTDIISAFLVTYKGDHFAQEINKDYLKSRVDSLKALIPQTVDPKTGIAKEIYQVSSARLDFFGLAEFFITLMSTMLTALGFLIMLTGVLLITNIQLMSVEDREFQTGVLRAVGDNRKGIFQSIMIENLFQGIIGGLIGLLGGLAFGQAVAAYLVGLFGTGAASVRPVISQETVILSVVIGVVLSIVTGILPALRASQVNVVEALRGIKLKFKAKSSRNLAVLGVLMVIAGLVALLYNGVFDKANQVFWSSAGWDSIKEWRNLLIGFGLFTGGLGFVLSKFIDRVKAFNITAITLWVFPSILFVVALGNWITGVAGLSIEILILGIIEIIIGSILFVALNLPIVMSGLRNVLVKVRGAKGVGQLSPALISSHITRSTLTFAIFAIILTINVLVAALIPTSLGTATQVQQDSMGVDFTVFLSKPEAIIPGTSYSSELYKIDQRITDVIGFKTFKPNQDFTKFVALKDPTSPEFNYRSDLLPIGIGEFKSEQIRGNASDYTDGNWRYAFYLSSFPDGIRQSVVSDMPDSKKIELSEKSWDQFFNTQYTMAPYNVSSELLSIFSGETDLSQLQLGSEGSGGPFSGSGADPLAGVDQLKNKDGNIVENPIVFTDSFLLPVGLQIWIPMNTSSTGLPNFQAFTIGGSLDSQRAGGFPLGTSLSFGSGDTDFSAILGNVYLPEYWTNQTNFLGEANGQTLTSRGKDQYNSYMIKTNLAIDDPQLVTIVQKIAEFTNTNDQGYRLLAKDSFYVASSTLTYSKIETTLQMTDRIASFLQIYVTFGLVIGAVGMGVISVRNVSERKREIGMMRAIGFSRGQVVLSVLFELVVLGLIGLAIGVVNGLLISVGFANMMDTALLIPWQEIGLYLSIIVLIAIGSGSIPAIVASRIPPAEALRYVG